MSTSFLCVHAECINHYSQTMRDILKRKFAEIDENHCCSSSSSPPSSLSSPASSEWESDGESSFSETQDFTPQSPSSPTTVPSKSSNHHLSLSLSNNANLFLITLCSHQCFIGVSLISLGSAVMADWYESADHRDILDNTQNDLMLDGLSHCVEMICLNCRKLRNQFQ